MTTGEEGDKPRFPPGPNAVDITPNKDGGVLKEIIKEGQGEGRPNTGCVVTTHYQGTLTDGTVFDSSTASGKPFEFTLGKGSVIKAWDIGIATMRKGEVAVFTCKSEYAYGKSGSPPKIPPDATLIFEITLLDWGAEDISPNNDKGILRTILQKGTGYLTPTEGSFVEIHLTGKCENIVFDDRDVSFNLGEGSEHNIIEGLEMALTKFTKEEKSSLEIKPKYAFKEEGHKEYGIPPNATVTYIVELKNFERMKESWDMDAAEKLSQALLLKEKAIIYFKEGKFDLAIKLYNNLMQYIDSDAGFSEKEENEKREAMLLAVRLNLGLAYLKKKEYYEAKKECEKVLEMDPNNVKGYFRRGQAYLGIYEPENAKKDFEAVLRLEPSNKLAASEVARCVRKIKQQKEKEKKIYANMFEKFAEKDKQASVTRFGWWDDEKKKPVIDETLEEDTEDLEERKAEKRRQLEHLKKVAQMKKEEKEKKSEGESSEEKKENSEKGESSKTSGL